MNARRTDDGLMVRDSQIKRYVAPNSEIPTSNWNKRMLDGRMISVKDEVPRPRTIADLPTDSIQLASGIVIRGVHHTLNGAFDVDLWYGETRTWAGMALIVVDDSEVPYEHFKWAWQWMVVAVHASARHAMAMHQIAPTSATLARITSTETAEYRCDDYVVAPGIVGSHAVAVCNAAPSDLSAERLPARDAVLKYERGPGPAILPSEKREFASGKCTDPVRDARAVEMRTMNHPPQVLPDREFGDSRVLFHEVVQVKPTHIGPEKWRRQDAAYFCQNDPGLIIGVWIAPGPALRENGCMQLVPGSQLDGAVSHGPKNDLNSYRIASQHAQAAERIAIELQTGDAPILHALRCRYFSPSASKLHRRAVQYHYYQIGTVWGDVLVRRRLCHPTGNVYGGCTIPRRPVPPGGYIFRSGLERAIVPLGPLE